MRLFSDVAFFEPHQWHNYARSVALSACAVTLFSALSLTTLRYWSQHLSDPSYALQLLQGGGTWLDPPTTRSSPGFTQWQPHGCLLRPYNWTDVEACMPLANGSRIVYAGDSTVRNPFWALVRLYDPALADQSIIEHITGFRRQFGTVEIVHYWDTYLNRSETMAELKALRSGNGEVGMFFAGTGLWYVAYTGDAYLDAFHDAMDPLLGAAAAVPTLSAAGQYGVVPDNTWMFNPIQNLSSVDLNDKRRQWWSVARGAELDDVLRTSAAASAGAIAAWSFHAMTAGATNRSFVFANDGVHTIAAVADVKTRVLLNFRCNSRLAEKGHEVLAGTCGLPYAQFGMVQWAVVVLFIGCLCWQAGKVAWRCSGTFRLRSRSWLDEVEDMEKLEGMIFRTAAAEASETRCGRTGRAWSNIGMILNSSAVLALLGATTYCLLGDRTFFFEKEALYPNPWNLVVFFTVIGIASIITLRPTPPAKDTSTTVTSLLNPKTLSEWEGLITLTLSALAWCGTTPTQSTTPTTTPDLLLSLAATHYAFLLTLNLTNFAHRHFPDHPEVLFAKIIRINALPLCLFLVLPGGSPVICATGLLTVALLCAWLVAWAISKVDRRIAGAVLSALLLGAAGTATSPWVAQMLEAHTPWWSIASPALRPALLASTIGLITGLLHHHTPSLPDFLVTPFTSPGAKTAIRLLLGPALLLITLSLVFVSTSFPPILTLSLLLSLPTYISTRALLLPTTHHSDFLLYASRYALELYVLRQHVFLSSDGRARARLGLLTGSTMVYQENVGVARAVDVVVLGGVILILAGMVGEAVWQVAKMVEGLVGTRWRSGGDGDGVVLRDLVQGNAGGQWETVEVRERGEKGMEKVPEETESVESNVEVDERVGLLRLAGSVEQSNAS